MVVCGSSGGGLQFSDLPTCGVASDTVEKVYLGDTGGALYVVL